MQEPAPTAITTPRIPRGIRLNNPGNIRHGPDEWQGKSRSQPDPEFVRFDAPVWGIRAICRVLLNYSRKGYDTPAEIATRWAPPTGDRNGAAPGGEYEQNTAAYIAHICKAVGAKPDEFLAVDSVEDMLPLVKAIIKHENGVQPYSDALIHEAMVKAGVSNAKPKSLLKSGEFTTKAVGVGLMGLGLVEQSAEPLRQMAETVAPFSAAPVIAKLSTLLMTLAGLAALASVAIAIVKRWRGLK